MTQTKLDQSTPGETSEDLIRGDPVHDNQKEDNTGMSTIDGKTAESEASAKSSSGPSTNLRPKEEKLAKMEEERPISVSNDSSVGNKGNNDGSSAASSSKSKLNSLKSGSATSPPSCTMAAPRINLFSPSSASTKLSNQKADYDTLDLNDTMMEDIGVDEHFFHFDEEGSPSRDFARASKGVEPPDQVDENSAPRKRGPSEPDHNSSAKRSLVSHRRSHQHIQDPLSLNTFSSTARTGASPGYQNCYGPYSSMAYNGESRTPSRSIPQHGSYPIHSQCYHYYSHYRHDRPYWVSRSLQPPGSLPCESDDDDIPPSPPSSPGARSSSAVDSSTPEKSIEKISTKSPFRSPRRDVGWGGSESKNNAALRQSPFLQRSPGMIGNLSFEMGTPSGTLPTDAYSPMGPSYEGFDEESSPPFQFNDTFGGTLMIGQSPSHGNSDGTPSPSTSRSGRRPQRSPISPYISDLLSFDRPNPANGNLIPSSNFDRHNHRYHHPESHSESFVASGIAAVRKHSKVSAVTMSGTKGEAPSSRLDPGAEPKQLWPPATDSTSKERPSSKTGAPGLVRLEIGGTGSINTRKKLEGINSMMQQSSAGHTKHSVDRKSTASGYSTTPGRTDTQHHMSSHHVYSLGELGTQSKTFSHIRLGHGGSRHVSYPPPAPGMKPMYPLKPGEHHYSTNVPPKPIYTSHPPNRDGTSLSQQHDNGIPPLTGKENNKKKPAPKRSPCNCKKSKCLKLYCECFAAERFCQGCNCTDCRNIPEFDEERKKAIKDTKTKNSKAFQSRFVVKNAQGADGAQKVHNMGCKCKKSECLKKYCECFNAGVFCGLKCKCADCLNYAGSQALVDKRNKMKDRPGAEYALRVSHEQWKSGHATSGSKPLAHPAHRRRPMPSPIVGMQLPHHMVHPSPRGPPPQGSHGYPATQQAHRLYYQHSYPHGYPPLGMPVTPGYHRPLVRLQQGESMPHGAYRAQHRNRSTSCGKPMPTPITKDHSKTVAGSPRTPAVRKPFDPTTNRKKRKVIPGEMEPTEPYFGIDFPQQPKITALAVFAFLSNDDLYHASLVCWRWSKLAMDEELWKFQEKV